MKGPGRAARIRARGGKGKAAGAAEKRVEVLVIRAMCPKCGEPVIEGQEREAYGREFYHKNCPPSLGPP